MFRFVLVAVCMFLLPTWMVAEEQTASRQWVKVSELDSKGAVAVAVSQDGVHMAVGTVHGHNVVEESPFLVYRKGEDEPIFRYVSDEDKSVYWTSVCFTPNGRYAVGVTNGGRVVCFDCRTGKIVRIFQGTPNGKSGGGVSVAVLRDPDDGLIVQEKEGAVSTSLPAKPFLAAAMAWSGPLVRLFDERGECVKELRPPKRPADATYVGIAASADGTKLVMAESDFGGWFWDLSKEDSTPVPLRTNSNVWSIAISPMGDMVAMDCDKGQGYLWRFKGRTATKRPFRVFDPKDQGQFSLAFDPSGKILATSSGRISRKTCLWDTETLKPIVEVQGVGGSAAITFNTYGDKLYVIEPSIGSAPRRVVELAPETVATATGGSEE